MEVSILFTAKVILFPIIIIFLLASSISLIVAADFNNPNNQFTKTIYSLLFSLILGLLCLIISTFFLFWIIIRITFKFDVFNRKLIIIKRGVFRTSTLEFNLMKSFIVYMRTHFSEEKRWLQLVVKEDDIYYKIYSWRGRRTQEKTFFQMLDKLQKQLQISKNFDKINIQKDEDQVIVSKDEFILLAPFNGRFREKNYISTVCDQELTMVDYDSLLKHFKFQKILGSSFPFEIHLENNWQKDPITITTAMIRKA